MSTVSDEPTNTFTEKWPNYSLFKQTIIYYVKSELKKNKKHLNCFSPWLVTSD